MALHGRGGSVCGLRILQISWHDCGAVLMGVYKVGSLVSKEAYLSAGGSVLFLYGGNDPFRGKDREGWERGQKEAGGKGRKEAETDSRQEE